MYLILCSQYDRIHRLGVVQSLHEGEQLIQSIPGCEARVDTFFTPPITFFSAEREALPDYCELLINNHRIPFSKHMFVPNERIDFELIPLTNLSLHGDGLIEGATQIDAFVIPNDEVATYVNKREAFTAQLMIEAEKAGFEKIERILAGSQDGEVVHAVHPSGKTLFVVLDPTVIEKEGSIADTIKDEIEEALK